LDISLRIRRELAAAFCGAEIKSAPSVLVPILGGVRIDAHSADWITHLISCGQIFRRRRAVPMTIRLTDMDSTAGCSSHGGCLFVVYDHEGRLAVQ
jgi:hypothetical protein